MTPNSTTTHLPNHDETIFDNLPPAPPLFSPRGLLLAATVAQVLLACPSSDSELDPPLSVSNLHALTLALHDSIDHSTISGPLLPRHSCMLDDIPTAHSRVKLSEVSDNWCRLTTRISTKLDLMRVRIKLGIPDVFRTSRRDRFDGDEALAILLSRISYPGRLFDLSEKWGRNK
ncbi:unnamed protein product, partial [Rhizoctonia solani]